MIRADIETEIAPLVGTEKQSKELVTYLLKEFENDTGKAVGIQYIRKVSPRACK